MKTAVRLRVAHDQRVGDKVVTDRAKIGAQKAGARRRLLCSSHCPNWPPASLQIETVRVSSAWMMHMTTAVRLRVAHDQRVGDKVVTDRTKIGAEKAGARRRLSCSSHRPNWPPASL